MGKKDFEACTECGLCCKVDIARRSKGILPVKEDGSCGFLGDDNRCTIYHWRPQVCRADTYKPLLMSWRKFWNLNADACNKAQEKMGYPLRWRVKKR